MDLNAVTEVGFTAYSMHFDNGGRLWCRLKNAMVLSYHPATTVINEPFGSERFRGVYWMGDEAVLIKYNGSIVSLNLSTLALSTIGVCLGASAPLYVNASKTWCVFSKGSTINQIALDGSAIATFELSFQPMSLLYTPNDQLWVGGDGLEVIDLGRGRIETITMDRELPILQMDYDGGRRIIAAAGGGIELFALDGTMKAHRPGTNFRCQFSRAGVLFSRTQCGNAILPPTISMDSVGQIPLCEISDISSFISYSEDGAEKLLVSEYDKLYFYS